MFEAIRTTIRSRRACAVTGSAMTSRSRLSKSRGPPGARINGSPSSNPKRYANSPRANSSGPSFRRSEPKPYKKEFARRQGRAIRGDREVVNRKTMPIEAEMGSGATGPIPTMRNGEPLDPYAALQRRGESAKLAGRAVPNAVSTAPQLKTARRSARWASRTAEPASQHGDRREHHSNPRRRTGRQIGRRRQNTRIRARRHDHRQWESQRRRAHPRPGL